MNTFTLIFTLEQLQLLNTAIGELPTKHGVHLINTINTQLQEAKILSETSKEKIHGD